MNYIEDAKILLDKELSMGEDYATLLNLYVLLIFTVGASCTREHVHDAWAVWQNTTDASHRSLKPYDELTVEVQQLDEFYRQAIVKVSKVMANNYEQERGSKV